MDAGSTVNSTVLLASFAVYTLAIIAVGLYSARYVKRSDEDYFLAGRSLGGWVAALSASASSESGWVTLGLVGWAFTSGVQAYWIIPGCLLGFLFNWFVLAARVHDRSIALNALTLPDLFAFNFRERVPLLRVLSVVVILSAMLLYVAAQLAAAGKFDEARQHYEAVRDVPGQPVTAIAEAGSNALTGLGAKVRLASTRPAPLTSKPSAQSKPTSIPAAKPE